MQSVTLFSKEYSSRTWILKEHFSIYGRWQDQEHRDCYGDWRQGHRHLCTVTPDSEHCTGTIHFHNGCHARCTVSHALSMQGWKLLKQLTQSSSLNDPILPLEVIYFSQECIQCGLWEPAGSAGENALKWIWRFSPASKHTPDYKKYQRSSWCTEYMT